MKYPLSLARFTDHNQTALKRERRERSYKLDTFTLWDGVQGEEKQTTYQVLTKKKNNLVRQEIDPARSCAKSLFSEITFRNSLARIMKYHVASRNIYLLARFVNFV